MRILSRVMILTSCALIVSGCASFHRHHRKQPPPPPPEGPRRVGTVASVNDSLKYVLLDVGTLYSPAPGTALKCFSKDGQQSAILAVNPERHRPFVAADIIEGEPKIGDEVQE